MTHPTYGPVELVVMAFPQECLAAAVGDALVTITDAGAVTLLDLIHVRRSDGGYLETFEIDGLGRNLDTAVDLADVGTAAKNALDLVVGDVDPGTSALVLVIEHTWARTLFEASENSGARLVMSERIPVAVVNSLVKQTLFQE